MGELEDFYDRNGHDLRIHYIQGLILKLQKALMQHTHAEDGDRRQDTQEASLVHNAYKLDVSKTEKDFPILSPKEEKKYVINEIST